MSSPRYDVVIVGSGMIGATFARMISEQAPWATILMIEAGPQLSERLGRHVRTLPTAEAQSLVKQRSQGPFADLTADEMAAPDTPYDGTRSMARPGTFPLRAGKGAPLDGGMPAAAMSSCVGGMGVHWTGAVPRPGSTETIPFIDPDELAASFRTAERIVGARTDNFHHSALSRSIETSLRTVFEPVLSSSDPVRLMPLAADRHEDGSLAWLGTDQIFGALADPEARPDSFTLRSGTLCRRILADDGRATGVVVETLSTGVVETIAADHIVVACDSLRTPQLLWASDIRPDALGRYLNDHISLIATARLGDDDADVSSTPRRNAGLDELRASYWIPFEAPAHPFHGQISYFSGLADAEGTASSGSVRLSWYSPKEIRAEDRLIFSDSEMDAWNMPRIDVAYTLTKLDIASIETAKEWQRKAAAGLGPFVAGQEPRVLPSGSSLHYQGTFRMGEDPADSVCDSVSKVWGMSNLYLGGNGIIPTATACNPTLTSMALAVRSAEAIVADLIQS
jgi:choline dehydrogenase-like flavoprotein